MAFKKGEGFKSVEEGGVHTGTEAWNIAQYYTGYSIALPLKDLNDLESIARFGTVKIDDDLQLTDDVIDKRRAGAVKRYWNTLKQIVSDTMFKVKSKDREEAQNILGELKKIPKYFDALLSLKPDCMNHDDILKINEDFLIKVMNKLVEYKQKYLYILDRAGLIFREVDEVDLDKLSNEFTFGG